MTPGPGLCPPNRSPYSRCGAIYEPDSIQLPFMALARHFREHPECVAPLEVPENSGHGRENPFLQYTQTISHAERFPLSVQYVHSRAAGTRDLVGGCDSAKLAAMREGGSSIRARVPTLAIAAVLKAHERTKFACVTGDR